MRFKRLSAAELPRDPCYMNVTSITAPTEDEMSITVVEWQAIQTEILVCRVCVRLWALFGSH